MNKRLCGRCGKEPLHYGCWVCDTRVCGSCCVNVRDDLIICLDCFDKPGVGEAIKGVETGLREFWDCQRETFRSKRGS